MVEVEDPLWLPLGLVTVLLRPFPWEASNWLVFLQSGESVLLLGLLTWRLKNIASNLLNLLRNPYLMYVIVFMVLNVVALSTVSNFGLLSRQRVIIFPFLFVLLAAQWAVDRRVDQNRLNQLQAVAT